MRSSRTERGSPRPTFNPVLLSYLAGSLEERTIQAWKGDRYDRHSRGQSALDSQRRVFKNDASMRRNTCKLRSLQENVRSRLAVGHVLCCHDMLKTIDHFLLITSTTDCNVVRGQLSSYQGAGRRCRHTLLDSLLIKETSQRIGPLHLLK